MKKVIYSLFAIGLIILAYAQVCLACGPVSYQPELPDKLKLFK